MTPEEFVAAGDYLVFKCPTWSWSSGDPSKRRSFLPTDKQFLITKAVPCVLRAKQMQSLREEKSSVMDWTDTIPDHSEQSCSNNSNNSNINSTNNNNNNNNEPKAINTSNEDRPSSPVALSTDESIPDMETFEDEDNVIRFVDPEEFKSVPENDAHGSTDNVIRSRTYDLSITYDKYYQTPRLWLCGYDESGKALDPAQVFEDISQEHARKTVTIESHPHLPDLFIASVHPCKHAHVMKSIVFYMQNAQRDENQVRVDRYLVLFLKFMGCVLPTIEYDHTMSV